MDSLRYEAAVERITMAAKTFRDVLGATPNRALQRATELFVMLDEEATPAAAEPAAEEGNDDPTDVMDERDPKDDPDWWKNR